MADLTGIVIPAGGPRLVTNLLVTLKVNRGEAHWEGWVPLRGGGDRTERGEGHFTAEAGCI